MQHSGAVGPSPRIAACVARTVAMLSLPLLLGGCALLYDGKYDHDEGWRQGVVTQVGLGAFITRAATVDCRKSFATTDQAQASFAYVTYRDNRYRKTRIVPIPRGMTFGVGDAVYVNRWHCDWPLHALDPEAPVREVLVPLWDVERYKTTVPRSCVRCPDSASRAAMP